MNFKVESHFIQLDIRKYGFSLDWATPVHLTFCRWMFPAIYM